MTRLYYEAHITIEPKPDADFGMFAFAAKEAEWRASKFDEDHVDDYNGKWFISARSEKLDVIKARVASAIKSLEHLGHSILRWKIEDTILDSKHGDTL